MKKLVVMVAAVPAIAAIIGASDASALAVAPRAYWKGYLKLSLVWQRKRGIR